MIKDQHIIPADDYSENENEDENMINDDNDDIIYIDTYDMDRGTSDDDELSDNSLPSVSETEPVILNKDTYDEELEDK